MISEPQNPQDFKTDDQPLKGHGLNSSRQYNFDCLMLMKNKFPENIKHVNEIHSSGSGFMLYLLFFIQAIAITYREMKIPMQVISWSS